MGDEYETTGAQPGPAPGAPGPTPGPAPGPAPGPGDGSEDIPDYVMQDAWASALSQLGYGEAGQPPEAECHTVCFRTKAKIGVSSRVFSTKICAVPGASFADQLKAAIPLMIAYIKSLGYDVEAIYICD